jgi:hypothetical protein
MAIHAYLRGRDSGVAGFFHSVMAVSAVHSQVSGMQLVAVWHRLLRRIAGFDVLRQSQIPNDTTDANDGNADYSASQAKGFVKSFSKDGAHELPIFLPQQKKFYNWEKNSL